MTGNKKYYYFIGIGGIGMSALARYFNGRGCMVAGYDRTESLLTGELQSEGIAIHFRDDIHSIPDEIMKAENQSDTLVVFTPAVPDEHRELNYFRDHDFQVVKRSEVLAEIFNRKTGIAVAGTHGKTTVSTMTAHILNQSVLKCTAFLGGISKNYTSNLLVNESSAFVVAEADEFDRSFLHLEPSLGIITSIDTDHLDVYGNRNELTRSFARFADNFRENAVLLVKNDVDLKINRKDIRIFNYSLDDGGDFYAQKIRIDGRRYCFDICMPDGEIRDISLPVPSLFNVENAVAASALAYLAGAKPDDIRSALETFSGIRRRFDMHCDGSIVYIDDYAHHPAEISFCLKSVRKLYPGRKICAVFQPHLYSRTKDLAEGFAESLDLADQIILLDIYPARENPIPGVDAGIIFDKIRNTAKLMCPKEKLIDTIKAGKPDILVTMGAGDIDMLVEPIIKMLQELK